MSTPLNIRTPIDILTSGLQLVGYSIKQQLRVKRQTNERRFKAHFGSCPLMCAVVWKDLQTCEKPLPSVSNKDFNLFLMTLFFLKSYPTEEIMASRFHLHEQTVRKWLSFYVERLAALRKYKIQWPSDWGQLVFIISVDCVNFGVNEPRHPTLHKIKKMFDRKGGKAGQTYEIALHLWENRIVWISGPHPPNDGGDRAIFIGKGENFKDGRACLNDTIPEGKMAIADKIYNGLEKVALHNSLDTTAVRVFKRRARSRQESINARMKSFGALRQRFRHGLLKQDRAVVAVAVLCQYQLENGSPLFDI